MKKPESVQENEIYKILWGFVIQTYHIIQARRPDLVLINKKKKISLCGFCRFWCQLSENKESEKIKNT